MAALPQARPGEDGGAGDLFSNVLAQAKRSLEPIRFRHGDKVFQYPAAMDQMAFLGAVFVLIAFFAAFPVWDHIFEVHSLPLDILELPSGTRPTAAEVQAAYKKQMRQWHPDANPGCGSECEQRVRLIRAAHAALTSKETELTKTLTQRRESLLYWTQLLTADVKLAASSAGLLVSLLPWYMQAFNLFVALHIAMVGSFYVLARRNVDAEMMSNLILLLKVLYHSAPIYTSWATRRNAGARRRFKSAVPAVGTLALAAFFVVLDELRAAPQGKPSASTPLSIDTILRLLVVCALTFGSLGERVGVIASCFKSGYVPAGFVMWRHVLSAVSFDFLCYCFQLPAGVRYLNAIALAASVVAAVQMLPTPPPFWWRASGRDSQYEAPPTDVAEEAEKAAAVAELEAWVSALVDRKGTTGTAAGALPVGVGVDAYEKLVSIDMALSNIVKGRPLSKVTSAAERRAIDGLRTAAEGVVEAAKQEYVQQQQRSTTAHRWGVGLMILYTLWTSWGQPMES